MGQCKNAGNKAIAFYHFINITMANTVQKVTQKFDIDFIMEFEG